jgi:hypothetical protein
VQLFAYGMPVSGMQVCSVCACMWSHACMQCAACMCVWCAFMWHIGTPGGVYSASALLVAKLSNHRESKISLNYFVNNVKTGKFSTI